MNDKLSRKPPVAQIAHYQEKLKNKDIIPISDQLREQKENNQILSAENQKLKKDNNNLKVVNQKLLKIKTKSYFWEYVICASLLILIVAIEIFVRFLGFKWEAFFLF